MIFQLRNEQTEYKHQLNLNCSVEDFDSKIMNNENYRKIVDMVEVTYGILDIEGEKNIFGYYSDEIEGNNFKTVLKIFKDYFKKQGLIK